MNRRDFIETSSLTLAGFVLGDVRIATANGGTNLTGNYFQLSAGDVRKILAGALSKGADFADVFLEHRVMSTISFDEGKVISTRHGIVLGAGIRAVKETQIGFAFSEDLTLRALLKAANTAAAIANDKHEKIRIRQINRVRTKNYYPVRELATKADLGRKLAFVNEADMAARRYDSKITRVQIAFNDEVRQLEYFNSDGSSWEDTQPLFMFQTTCIAEGEKGRRESGYASGGGRIGLEYFQKRSAGEIAKDAARVAVTNLSAVEAEAGLQSVVLSGGDCGVLLHEAVGHGLEADLIYRKLSCYSGRSGESVASGQCTVMDEGSLKNMRGSINIDDEGNLPQSTVLIEDGILRGYMNDRISARQLGTKPSGNGRRQAYNFPPIPRMTNTYLRPGKYVPDEILQSVKKGIYAKRFTSGNVNVVDGNFTFSCSECYQIENGRIAAPLKGVTLSGNALEVMKKITMVGSDLRFADGWNCSKDGQIVPVGVGIPTVRISEIAVGGTKI